MIDKLKAVTEAIRALTMLSLVLLVIVLLVASMLTSADLIDLGHLFEAAAHAWEAFSARTE